MKTTIKALDHFDALKAGHTYSIRVLDGSRLVACTDDVSLQIISLYQWQIEDGMLRGKLVYTDSPVSPAMSCSATAQLCHTLPSGYLY